MNTKKNIPTNWKWVTLNDIGLVVSGGTPSTKEPEFWSDEISWITPSDLSKYNEIYISKGRRNISKVGLEYSSAKLLPKDSVLFSSRAPIGYVAIAKNELATNQGFKNLILTNSINPKYVYYYLTTIKELAEKMASGTTFLELSATKFKQIPFPLPPFEEQNRIVNKVEEHFSELEKINTILKNQIKNISKAKISVKYNYLNESNTKTVSLSEIFTVKSSKRIFKSEYVKSGIPFYRIKEIIELESEQDLTECKYLSKARYEEIKTNYGVPSKGDILITAIGTIGVIYIVPNKSPFYFKDGNIIWLEKKVKDINSEYIKLAIENEINKITNFSGSTYNALKIETINSINIFYPKREVQDRIQQKIENQLVQLKILEKEISMQISKVDVLSKKILSEAFQGSLSSQLKSDNSIDKVLKQIKNEKVNLLNKQRSLNKDRPKIARKKIDLLKEIKTLFDINAFGFYELTIKVSMSKKSLEREFDLLIDNGDLEKLYDTKTNSIKYRAK